MHLYAGHTLWHLALPVVHEHEVLQRRERRHERLKNRPQRRVAENHFVLGVIHDVGELLREEPEVQGVQHAA